MRKYKELTLDGLAAKLSLAQNQSTGSKGTDAENKVLNEITLRELEALERIAIALEAIAKSLTHKSLKHYD